MTALVVEDEQTEDERAADALTDRLGWEPIGSFRDRYLELLPTRTAALRNAADLPELVMASHSLAGASAQFGYPALAALCRQAEQGGALRPAFA